LVISGFDWDDDYILHIERHDFTVEEVEEVFAGAPRSGAPARGVTSPWEKSSTAGWLLWFSAAYPEAESVW
jgi:hypothetical protein